MKAFYFSGLDCKLRYGDGRVIEKGITHTIEGAPKLCGRGLHASKHAWDALSYAPGEMLWLVELGGDMDKGEDKIAAQSRTYIDGFDATELLRDCSRKYARDVLHLWDAPQVVVDYLHTGDESLRDAAWAAAWDAAWAAAWDAARDRQKKYFARRVNAEFRKRGSL